MTIYQNKKCIDYTEKLHLWSFFYILLYIFCLNTTQLFWYDVFFFSSDPNNSVIRGCSV